jgi:hypothetical protein
MAGPGKRGDEPPRSPSPSERRRWPRLPRVTRLRGQVVTLSLQVRVRDVSLGGLAIETEFAFPIGALHHLRLTLTDGSSSAVAGRVVYSNPAPDRAGYYVTGFAFVDQSLTTGAGVAELIGRITAVE